MFTIHPTPNPLEDAYTHLNTLLRGAQGKDILLLLSGGSALALADHIDVSLLGKHVTISVLDERWTYELKDSNFAQLVARPFWQNALDANISFIDPCPHEPEDVQDTAKRFDLALKHWHITHRDGVVIATMGIGEDGHTAGILPFPEDPEMFKVLFEHTSTCVRGYTVPPAKNAHRKRMTVTLTYLNRHVHHAVVYVSGSNKKETLIALQTCTDHNAKTPACILQEMMHADIFTDNMITLQ
ncbi:MAG: 6-phosphogluconolactonase [Candidatus Pacebacteria bacterium]|nr:6-phosphogluconolactonase [Candidatus Paceibacterota bacterium]